jgi:hypothetical protein
MILLYAGISAFEKKIRFIFRLPTYLLIPSCNGSYGNRVGRCELDASGSGQGPMAGSCEHGNEPMGSIKGQEFLLAG